VGGDIQILTRIAIIYIFGVAGAALSIGCSWQEVGVVSTVHIDKRHVTRGAEHSGRVTMYMSRQWIPSSL